MMLWLQRHAAVLSEPGLCYGRSNVPADPVATQQAALALGQALPVGVALWTSPLVRCTALADAVTHLRPDLAAPRVDPRLAEMDFGTWEGRPWSQIGRAEFDAWTANFALARAGGSGESTQQFMARVEQAWQDGRQAGTPAAWITHAGVMRAVQLLHSGVREVRRAEQWPAAAIAYGECLQLKWAPGVPPGQGGQTLPPD